MYKFMKKIPGGLLLVPMLLSALINTLAPTFFSSLGGISNALFTTNGINYVVGAACFCSATSIDLKKFKLILKKQGELVLIKTIICIFGGFVFIKLFNLEGVAGISAIAFITAICSTNPSLYLALEQDYGNENDVSAFGLIGLLCVPAYPMLIFSLSQATTINWTPIISALLPIIFGVIIGNLDKDMAKFFAPGVIVLTPFMGISFGAGINLLQAFKSGGQGILLTILFYIIIVPIMFIFERKFLKEDGISTISMASIAGMSASVPALIGMANPKYQPFVEAATAQIAFGVVLTSVITPIIASKLYKHDHIEIYKQMH